MKIVKIMGGLGNQMFEYIFGFVLSQKTNEKVFYDLSWFDEIKNHEGSVAKRVYELECFNIEPKFATPEQVQQCIKKKFKCPKFLRKILKKKRDNIYQEKICNVYEPKLLEIEGNAYFDGYFQCEKYFKEYRNDILKFFSLKYPLNEQNKEMLKKIKSTNSISLHVRRGDYVNLQEEHGLCNLNYYEKAIDYIALKTKNPHFYLFSDDIEWVIKNLKMNYPYTIVDINDVRTGYFDLELMKNCKHNIIANSSFSWWGAWLNQNPDKIVVAPQRWFAGEKLEYKDIIPESWVKC